MPAAWLALPLWILAGYYVTLLEPSDAYLLDATAKATATLPFVGAVCAACAAWEGNRLRRGGLWELPLVRSRLAIAGWRIVPSVLVGMGALAVAVGVQFARSGVAAGLPDPVILGSAGLDLLAYSAAGFAAGILMPFALAGPIVLIATVVWLAFVPAVEPVWLRHLTGMFRDCCDLAADLSPRAVAASAVVNVGILVAAALVTMRRSILGRAAAAGSLAAALVVGGITVAGMPHAPETPRGVAELDCADNGGVVVCIWPEHRPHANTVRSLAARTYGRWRDAGVDAPTTFTEANEADAPANALSFRFRGSAAGEDDIIAAFAKAMLPRFPNCPAGSTGGIAFEYLEAWYSAAAGMSREALERRFAFPTDPYEPVLTVVDQLTAAGRDAQGDWIVRAQEVSQACDDWATERLAVNP
jgi:hypothetical protein